jgi:hypothetical protein
MSPVDRRGATGYFTGVSSLHLTSKPLAYVCLSLLFWLALHGAAAGQEGSTAARDPDGARHAVRLWDAYEASGEKVDDPTFLQLFEEDPNLSRRAFLPLYDLWETEADQQRTALAERLLPKLAALANASFGDHIPNLIIDAINEDNPGAEALMERYTEFLLQDAKSGVKLTPEKLKKAWSV